MNLGKKIGKFIEQILRLVKQNDQQKMNFVEKLERKLQKWMQRNSESFLINTKFDKSDLSQRSSDDKTEQMILDLF